jgi:integrase
MLMAIHKLGRSENKLHTLPDGAYGDGNNLWLLVRNGGGSRTWIFRWKNRSKDAEGKKRDRVISLGPLRIISMEEARANAVNYCRMLRDDKDPEKERDEQKLKEQIKQGKARTVRQVAEEYARDIVSNYAKNTRRTVNRALARINREIGDMPIGLIDEKIILDNVLLKDNLWNEKNPTAVRLRFALEGVFDLAISRGYVPRGHNPALLGNLSGGLTASKRVHKTKHHPYVPWQRIGEFMKELRAYTYKGYLQCYKGRPPIALCIELIALTGCRPGEARIAQWKEFDFIKMIWTIPIPHLKMGHIYSEDQPKRVPITKAMLTVLDHAKRIAYPTDSSQWMDGHKRGRIFPRARHKPDCSPEAFVFPSSVNRPFNESDLARFMRDTMKKWRPARPHGFRSALKDWWKTNAERFPMDWWEIQVDHRGEALQKAYGGDDVLEKRRRPMEEWGELCSRPERQPGKVIRLEKRRTG